MTELTSAELSPEQIEHFDGVYDEVLKKETVNALFEELLRKRKALPNELREDLERRVRGRRINGFRDPLLAPSALVIAALRTHARTCREHKFAWWVVMLAVSSASLVHPELQAAVDEAIEAGTGSLPKPLGLDASEENVSRYAREFDEWVGPFCASLQPGEVKWMRTLLLVNALECQGPPVEVESGCPESIWEQIAVRLGAIHASDPAWDDAEEGISRLTRIYKAKQVERERATSRSVELRGVLKALSARKAQLERLDLPVDPWLGGAGGAIECTEEALRAARELVGLLDGLAELEAEIPTGREARTRHRKLEEMADESIVAAFAKFLEGLTFDSTESVGTSDDEVAEIEDSGITAAAGTPPPGADTAHVPVSGHHDVSADGAGEVETEQSALAEEPSVPATAVTEVSAGPAAAPASAEAAIEEARGTDESESGEGRTVDGAVEEPQDVLGAPAETHEISIECAGPSLTGADVTGFREFKQTRFVRLDGSVCQAPWMRADYDVELARLSEQALANRQFYELAVLQAAHRERRIPEVVPQDDLVALSSVLRSPSSSLTGLDPGRSTRLIGWTIEENVGPSAIAIAATLEAVRPSVERPLSDDEIDAILCAAALDDGALTIVLAALLRYGGRGGRPVAALSEAIARVRGIGKVDLEGRLQELRLEFDSETRRHWGCEGKVQRTHCRRAWGEFRDDHLVPLRQLLRPSGKPDDHRDWNLELLARQASALERDHERIADRRGADFEDRTHMDNAVRQLAGLATRIVETATQLRSVSQESMRPEDQRLPVEDVLRIVESASMAPGTVAGLCRYIVAVALEAAEAPESDVLHFPARGLARRPDLLPLTDERPDMGRIAGGVSAFDIRDPLRAAAVLMGPVIDIGESVDNVWRELFEALESAGRYELQAIVLPAADPEPHDRSVVNQRAAALGETVQRSLAELDVAVRDLERILAPGARTMRQYVNEVRGAVAPQSTTVDHRILLEWTRSVNAAVAAQLYEAKAKLREDASGRPESQRDAVLSLLDEGRYEAAAAYLLDASQGIAADGDTRLRETRYRDEAENRYPSPSDVLRSGSETLGRAAPLARLWNGKLDTSNARKELRKAFIEFVARDDMAGAGKASKERSAAIRKLEPQHVRVIAARLRERLSEEGLNPTFVPQLRNWANLVIDVFAFNPNARPREIAQKFVSDCAEKRASVDGVVAFLSPGLRPEVRDEILRTARAQRCQAAVLDDLDLCRLIAPEDRAPHGYLGLLEILLEQLRWDAVSPFGAHDGVNATLDMFVGRSQYAEDLARRSRYTRVFSGRKLGKSALLQYVRQAHDNTKLPSGNILRVISIVAAGGEKEQWLVDAIAAEMVKIGFEARRADTGDPGEQLRSVLDQYLAARPKESLLVVLDEADMFVENQLDEYETRLERCLSFRMMKEFTQTTDANDIPRVRFVLAGYRVTGTEQGAWANAGDVLRLVPLEEFEAERLVAGPLARLGIDASREAAHIARRCGNQPAVLLRFGNALFERVREREIGTRIEILESDVEQTYCEPEVQGEIRTVVRNNFQSGNDGGAAVFEALLDLMSEQPSWASVENPKEAILARLELSVGDVDWLAGEGTSPEQEVHRHLRDFIARGLIVAEDSSDRRRLYRLRFPHQLATLVEDDLTIRLRDRVEKARRRDAVEPRPNGLLSRYVVSSVAETGTSVGREFGIRARVIGVQWSRAAEDGRAGVAAMLGYRDFETGRGMAGLNHPVVYGAGRAELDHVLSAERRDIPLLVGGLDLLRGALERHSEVESWGYGRLQRRRVEWWFETRRLLQFRSRDAMAKIFAATGGIPLLVGALDAALIVADDSEVADRVLEVALGGISLATDTIVETLIDGPDADRLSRREAEIVVLLSAAATFAHVFPIDDGIGPQGIVSAEQRHLPEPFGTVRDDDQALRLLALAGLIPLDGTGQVCFESTNGDCTDPIQRIGDALSLALGYESS
jgi:hypothetical protein